MFISYRNLDISQWTSLASLIATAHVIPPYLSIAIFLTTRLIDSHIAIVIRDGV
jgi:hypothetical protein